MKVGICILLPDAHSLEPGPERYQRRIGGARRAAGPSGLKRTGWRAQGRREMSAPLVPPLVGSWATNSPPAGLGARSVTEVNGCSLPSGAVYEVAYWI